MNSYGPVLVELLTPNLRISGFSKDADQSRRLSDVLNMPAQILVLENATLRNLADHVVGETPYAVIQKRDILFAVPRESSQQVSAHRAQRIGLGKVSVHVPWSSLVTLPPFLATGTINFHSKQQAYQGVASLTRFFPLLDATVLIDGQTYLEANVALVNRDAVSVLGLQDEAGEDKRAPSSLISDDKLDHLVSELTSLTQADDDSSGITAADLERLRGIG